MAPSGHNGATTTDTSRALRRKRSVAELKRDVLSLVHRARSALPSDSDGTRLEAHYQRFHGACSPWVSVIFGRYSASIDAPNSGSTQQKTRAEVNKQQQRESGQVVEEQLSALTQFTTYQQRGCGETRELVAVVVRSIGTTAQIQKRRRKRKLPTASAISSVMACDGDTSGDLCRVAEFIGVWLLHTSGLLRLEDVALGVVSSGAAETWEWLTAPVHYLLSHKARHLHLTPPAAHADVNTVVAAMTTTTTTTTHNIVEAVIQYIIRLAFTDSRTTKASLSSKATTNGSYNSHASEQVAMQTLEELCFFTCAGFSISTLRLVTRLLSKKVMLDDRDPQTSLADSSRNFGRLVVARDRVVAFLQPQIAKLASPYSLVQAAYTRDELEEMFAAYQSCLPTSTFVQIIRQFIYEANGSSSSDVSPDVAVSGEPKSVICDALYHLILSVASKRRDFVDQVLTLAHELASEGLQSMNGFLLRHSLELVAAVSSGANTKNAASSAESAATATSSNAAVNIYRDWVRDHFAAGQDTNAGSKVTTADDSRSTTPATAFPPRCLKQRKTCGLVLTKRQIQFLCAFLLEFNRREQQSNRRNGDAGVIPSQYPVAKSEHVAAHLSVMKTHQPQFPSGGLIMDFCSQTRSRYLELLKIEQSATAAANAVEAATKQNAQSNGTKQRTQSSLLHSVKVRNMVRENIQLYRDTNKLSPQLRQWKMFQPQLWKQELIPCCLDTEYNGLGSATEVSCGDGVSGDCCAAETRLLEHVAFVHALAKSGLVSVQEYSQFLTRAEEWLERRQKRKRLKKTAHKRQRHETEGERFGPTLERLQQEISEERHDTVWRRKNPVAQEMLGKLQEALETTLVSLYGAAGIRGDTVIPTKQMQSLWEDGCMRVLELLGLDEVETFFAYLVPVLGRAMTSSQRDATDATPSTTSQPQDKDATMTEVSIATFFVSQVSWTERCIDERFIHEVSCLAAVVAGLLGKNGESHSPELHPDLVHLIQRIDEKCLAGDDASVAIKLLSRDRLLRRSLFYSTVLRAAASLSPDKEQAQARIVTSLLQCETLDAGTRDFISWIGYRSITNYIDASQNSQTRAGQAVPGGLGGETRVPPLQFLLENLCAVSQMRWCKEAFALRRITKDQLQKVVTLEFRYGLKLFAGGASTSTSASFLLPSSAGTVVNDAGDPREWLQMELDIIADLGGFRIASLENVIEWIITEILFQVTALSSSDGADELTSVDNAVGLMLLVLNDLMHKVNAQDAVSVENCGLPSRSHSRILAFFVTSATKLIRENGRVFPVNLGLQHHGFEVLEICARHHIDCRFSTELIHTGSGGLLLELLGEIGDHFASQFPWSLFQALFFYLVELTRSDKSHQDTHPPAVKIRDLPAAVVVWCAMEYPRLRTVLKRWLASNNGSGTGKYDVFTKHLKWIHQFSKQVIQEDNDLVTNRESGFDEREAPLLDESETFSSEVDKVKYQMLIVKFLFRWKLVRVPDLTTQSHLVSAFYIETAVRILRAFGVSARSGSRQAHSDIRVMDEHSKHMVLELATCFTHEWLQTAFAKRIEAPDGGQRNIDFEFQLFLVHAVAELCKRSAQVCKTVLQLWRKSPSNMVDGSALFIVLLAISLGSDDDTNTDGFNQVLGSNSSMWLNEFPKIALHVHSLSLLSSEPGGEESSLVLKLIKVIANVQSFTGRLVLVLSKVLKHGIANQVGVLDAKLPLRIRQVWPSLSAIVSQLHVLSLNNDGDPSEF